MNESNKSERGNKFDEIIKIIIRTTDIFDIDGYFEVNELIKMNLVNIYEGLNNNYILSKKVIFINQTLINAQFFVFAIYEVEDNKLILFQAKYKIDKKNINKRDYYQTPSQNILQLFWETFKIKIDSIYLLYISSYEYNYNNEDLIDILSNNLINCLFYSLEKNIFSFELKNKKLLFPIATLECKDCFKIIPLGNYYNIILGSEKNFRMQRKYKKTYNEGGITKSN